MLGREYLLAGHLVDRAGMPHLVGPYGRDVMRDIAIDEWMAASPVYTRRIQRLLGFAGQDDVATIFKGMQFDIGAPHQFMDFRYEVHDDHHGEFRLAHCGALMDVEPMGEDFVVAMCHHIEDPTFDATACATNPRAKVRPVHRPPRSPTDRHPHCHWTVEIVPTAAALEEPDLAVRLATTNAAKITLDSAAAGNTGPGRTDYAGPLDPDLRLEDFSATTLARVNDEVCLQSQLLAMAFMAAVELRYGAQAAIDIGTRQLVGIAGLTSWRLRKAFGLGPDGGLDAIAVVLDAHPAFRPRPYVALDIVRGGGQGGGLLIVLKDSPALHETYSRSWASLLDDDGEVLAAAVQGVDARARCAAARAPAGAHLAWEVTLDPDAERVKERSEVLLTRFSTGADFAFT